MDAQSRWLVTGAHVEYVGKTAGVMFVNGVMYEHVRENLKRAAAKGTDKYRLAQTRV
jgi:hypothetical protein